jgi:hypothetical protein
MPALWWMTENLWEQLQRRAVRRNRSSFVLSEQAQSMLAEYFADDNARLCQLINYEIAKFGYPMNSSATDSLSHGL